MKKFINIPNKPNDIKEVIYYIPNRKLIGVISNYFGDLVVMEYEWYGEYWQKVANLGQDIMSVKRKYSTTVI